MNEKTKLFCLRLFVTVLFLACILLFMLDDNIAFLGLSIIIGAAMISISMLAK